MSFRGIQPDINPFREIELKEPIVHNFKNNIPLYVFPSDENFVKLKFSFKAGNYFQNKPLQAYFTNKMLTEGTASYSAEQIAEFMDFYGVSFVNGSDDDRAAVTVVTLKKNFEIILPILNEVLFKPIFPEKRLNTQKKITLQQFRVSNEKVANIAKNHFLEMLFGNNNNYGYRTTEDDFLHIEKDDLTAFHQSHYLGGLSFVTLTGNIGEKELNAACNFIENLPLKKENIPTLVLNLKNTEGIKTHIEKSGALQSGLRLGRTLFNRTHPDFIAFRLMNMVLGGYFGSRLMNNIRERNGYTYGIYSMPVSLEYAGYFTIATEVGCPVKDAALKEIYYEISELQNKKIGEEELQLVKNYMTGQFLRQIDGQINFSSLYENLIPYGFDTTYLHRYLTEIRETSAETLLSIAQRYLSTDKLFEVTAG